MANKISPPPYTEQPSAPTVYDSYPVQPPPRIDAIIMTPPVSHTDVSVNLASRMQLPGTCPNCNGRFTGSYSCCAWLWCLLCFPCGIICCLCMRRKKCSSCGLTIA